ncbi:hypothetical protein GCM10023169_29980 [Georgenia halophila]|uniref:Uncharacterized protein n=1 Tax=Georgenia halophila TaxID=620889 RepID=A0ABP8LGS2_9MICO
MKNGELDDDTVWLIVICVFVAPIVLGALPGLLPDVEQWLLDLQVLVAENATWVPPGMTAGLDLPRIALGLAAVVFLATALGGLARTALRGRAGR